MRSWDVLGIKKRLLLLIWCNSIEENIAPKHHYIMIKNPTFLILLPKIKEPSKSTRNSVIISLSVICLYQLFELAPLYLLEIQKDNLANITLFNSLLLMSSK